MAKKGKNKVFIIPIMLNVIIDHPKHHLEAPKMLSESF
ncbi:hypothetical protein JCM19233_1920 [Vibrio astriarenae]|nr:hypothetical protein JCM19233_1920 [Vibrio sp. C7]